MIYSSESEDFIFLDLLKPENLQKIKIDKELILAFQNVIYKLNDYFVQSGLIKAKNWKTFLNEFLLNEGPKQHSIKFNHSVDKTACVGGEYSSVSKVISVCDYSGDFEALCASLCHEFIHFLVMADSNVLACTLSSSYVLNEGMTELLTMQILYGGKYKTITSYFNEIEMSQFYCNLSSDKNPFYEFLNDRFTFDDNYAKVNISRYSDRFGKTGKKEMLVAIQRELINKLVDFDSIDSFDKFVSTVEKINKRPFYDFDYSLGLYERITDSFLNNTYILEKEKQELRKKLIDFCVISNKATLYKDNEVAEFLIDDIYMAFDKNGNYYNEFPSSGTVQRGQVQFDGKMYRIVHKDKEYRIDIRNLKCKNWSEIYKKYLNYFKEYNLEEQEIIYEKADECQNYLEELKMKINECQNNGDYKTASELKTQFDIISLIYSIEPSQQSRFIEEKLAEFEAIGNYEARAYWLQALAILESQNEKSLK